ncbi:MAG TPA: glycosyltransferase [Bryobacteraceae bacterium]|nr:glycosyltransferase [Bryobacteraceae bacterium]
MPVYNEEELVAASIRRVLEAPLPAGMAMELVVVDDGSADRSAVVVEELAREHPEIVLVRHPVNRGKGAAIRTAIQHASGQFAIVQDADLEYDPREFEHLLEPLLAGTADVVYGSRFQTLGRRRVLYFWHALANRILTMACNIAADLTLTDMETCYKAFRTAFLKSIPVRSNRFGFEPEITIKCAQRQARIYEVPISYNGRTYEEGKKIGLKDALQALAVIFRYWLTRDIYVDPGGQILDTLAHTPRFNSWMADVIQPLVGSRVLELGAGIGNLTRHFSRGRLAYIATDIDPEHLARLRTRFQNRPTLQVKHCDLTCPEDFQPFMGQVDSVICLNVVEHVKDDGLALRNIWSALPPGGRAVILVPQGQRIYGTLDEVLGHYRRYSEEELRGKMQQAGFRVDKIIPFNRITRPAWYINGRLRKKRTFGRFQLWVFDRLVWFWRRVDRFLLWDSVSLIAVGVKE